MQFGVFDSRFNDPELLKSYHYTAQAGRYAETDAAEEAALYRTAGGVGVGVQHLATTEPAAMADYGGAMALFQFRE